MAVLVSFSGLPGVGKTTLAKALAKRVGAFHLRVDSVENALEQSVLNVHPAEDAGYLAIAAVAVDNLRLGLDVIADTVNPIEITRTMWAEAADAGHGKLLNVEVVCSDQAVHRHRVETRLADLIGLALPDWRQVSNRAFEPWLEDRVIVDTSVKSIEQCVSLIAEQMKKLGSEH